MRQKTTLAKFPCSSSVLRLAPQKSGGMRSCVIVRCLCVRPCRASAMERHGVAAPFSLLAWSAAGFPSWMTGEDNAKASAPAQLDLLELLWTAPQLVRLPCALPCMGLLNEEWTPGEGRNPPEENMERGQHGETRTKVTIRLNHALAEADPREEGVDYAGAACSGVDHCGVVAVTLHSLGRNDFT